jgi:hypothetical protein
LARRQANFARGALRDPAPEFAGLAVHDEERAPLGFDDLGRFSHDERKQGVEGVRRRHGLRDLEDGVQLLDATPR